MDPVNGGAPTARQLPQFRVTLNARCGRACFFCRPSGEAIATAPQAELAVDDLLAVASAVRRFGVVSIKLTGGDPALYGPLEEAVFRLRHEAGFKNIELISRHPKIGPRAAQLAASGVTQFNVSIDTLDPELHHDLCGVDDLPGVLQALDDCVATGVPCKVNMVVMGGVNDGQIPELLAYCSEHGVRMLKLLDVIKDLDAGTETFAKRLAIKRRKQLHELYAPLDEVAAQLRAVAVREAIRRQGDLGHPMSVFLLDSGLEVVLKDSRAGAWYGPICHGCRFFRCHDALMALRLTADLRLQFCLLREDIAVPLEPLIRQDPVALELAVERALNTYANATFMTPVSAPATANGLVP